MPLALACFHLPSQKILFENCACGCVAEVLEEKFCNSVVIYKFTKKICFETSYIYSIMTSFFDMKQHNKQLSSLIKLNFWRLYCVAVYVAKIMFML